MGNVASYAGGIDPLVYLVSSIGRLLELGLPVVTTDRNAALATASHGEEGAGVADIDWDLMRGTYWHNTVDEPDRRERRMAECLVHRRVPWTAVTAIHVRTEARAAEVRTIVAEAGATGPVAVTPGWYF